MTEQPEQSKVPYFVEVSFGKDDQGKEKYWVNPEQAQPDKNKNNCIVWQIQNTGTLPPDSGYKFLGVAINSCGADGPITKNSKEWKFPRFNTIYLKNTDGTINTTINQMIVHDKFDDLENGSHPIHSYSLLYTNGVDGLVRVIDPGIQNQND